MDVLTRPSSRERELENTLILCADAIATLMGIPVGGPRETKAEWQERLQAVWDARARALERIPRQRL